MARLSERWKDRSATERFDLYTRGSLYLLSGMEIFFAVVIVGNAERTAEGWVIVFVAVAAVHSVTGLVVLHRGVGWYLTGERWPAGLAAVHLAIGAAGVAATLLAFPRIGGLPSEDDVAGLGILLFVALSVASLTPRLTSLQLLVGGVAAAVLATVMTSAVGWGTRASLGTGAAILLGVFFVAGTYRVSVWMLGIVWELERSREVETRLAVAEERLRIARDLHDVLGRNLSVIALKSELGAELARRGHDSAGGEMAEVQRIAQESLREVREVVRGYRQADLASELAGARAVLRSAGVDTRIAGDGSELPRAVQEALAWVIREGTTNVLRHSEATECVITVAVEEAPGEQGRAVVVTMDNDGVPPGRPAGRGNGLTGLAERLDGVGGSLDAAAVGDGRFRLSARLRADGGQEGAG